MSDGGRRNVFFKSFVRTTALVFIQIEIILSPLWNVDVENKQVVVTADANIHTILDTKG